jgi:hypothetical protein
VRGGAFVCRAVESEPDIFKTAHKRTPASNKRATSTTTTLPIIAPVCDFFPLYPASSKLGGLTEFVPILLERFVANDTQQAEKHVQQQPVGFMQKKKPHGRVHHKSNGQPGCS